MGGAILLELWFVCGDFHGRAAGSAQRISIVGRRLAMA